MTTSMSSRRKWRSTTLPPARRARCTAKPRVIERLPQDVDVTHLEALGGDDIVYRTVEYQSRLVRIDGLPLVPLAPGARR